MRFEPFVVAMLLSSNPPGVQAGTLSGGAWTATGCGVRPATPTLDLKDSDAFNRSVDVVNAHLKAIRAYVDCLTAEANADLQAVSQSATATQTSVREARDRLLADVKAAEQKLNK